MAAPQALFDTTLTNTAAVQSDLWVDLGLIATGQKVWFGFGTYFSEDKTVVFELRSNLTGQSAATKNATTLHDSVSVTAGNTSDRDYYKNGRISIRSATGTGVEHYWLHLRSKSNTAGDVNYFLYYTLY